jgi:hypothetical protein
MADEAEGTETETDAGATGSETDEGTASSTATGEEKTLSQAEVDRIVQDRLARAAKGQPSKDELAELRRKAAAHDEADEASKSELEKAQAAREKAEAKAAEAVQTANARLIRADATAELAKAGVTNVDGALRALDTTGLTVEDDGTVSGVEEAVKGLLEAIPEFVGRPAGTKVDQGARGTSSKDGQVTAAELEDMSTEDIAKATREGRMVDLLGG